MRTTSSPQKRQQGLNTFITRLVREARCSKLKLMQTFFFGETSGRGATKVDHRVDDALPLGVDDAETTASATMRDALSRKNSTGTTTIILE